MEVQSNAISFYSGVCNFYTIMNMQNVQGGNIFKNWPSIFKVARGDIKVSDVQ